MSDTDRELLLADLEYWRVFLLRARQGSGKTQFGQRIHIDHLTAAAMCINNAIKALRAA